MRVELSTVDLSVLCTNNAITYSSQLPSTLFLSSLVPPPSFPPSLPPPFLPPPSFPPSSLPSGVRSIS